MGQFFFSSVSPIIIVCSASYESKYEDGSEAQYVNHEGELYDATATNKGHSRIAVGSIDTYLTKNDIKKVQPGTAMYVVYGYLDYRKSFYDTSIEAYAAFDDKESA